MDLGIRSKRGPPATSSPLGRASEEPHRRPFRSFEWYSWERTRVSIILLPFCTAFSRRRYPPKYLKKSAGHLGQLLYDASRAAKHGCLPLLPQCNAARRHDLLFVWPCVAEGRSGQLSPRATIQQSKGFEKHHLQDGCETIATRRCSNPHGSSTQHHEAKEKPLPKPCHARLGGVRDALPPSSGGRVW